MNLLRLLLCPGLLFGLAECRSNDPEPIVVVDRTDTLSLARVRALAEFSVPSSIQVTDPGMEGTFQADVGDRESPDNTGTILVTANGVRYKRAFSGPASAAWFGVSEADDDVGPELQVAVNVVDDVVVPDGTYTQRTLVRLRSGMTLRGNPGKVLFRLPASYTALANPIDHSIHLRDVVIDGLAWEVTTREDGRFGLIYIDTPSVTNLTIRNCRSTDEAAKDSTNWLTVKLPAGKTGRNIVVENNTVRAKRMGCEIFNHDNFNQYAGSAITVRNNAFSNCYFGISLSGPLDSLTVTDNRLKDCAHYGIEIAGAARRVVIVGNTFEGRFDKFLIGSNDGGGNGSVVGGMVVENNRTLGQCQGGVQLYNGGTVQFRKNDFSMTGTLELLHSTNGGLFTENRIESTANKAIICDNTANHTFRDNVLSTEKSPGNQAVVMAYGNRAINNSLINNKLIKGPGGKYYEAVEGGSLRATQNFDGQGNPLAGPEGATNGR